MTMLGLRGYCLINSPTTSWRTAVCRTSSALSTAFPRVPRGCTPSVSSLHVSAPSTAGHNKWSKIKHRKTAADQARSKDYAKLSAEISSSVRQAGDNPDFNLRLASALSRARKLAVPKGTIDKAIALGRGSDARGEAAESVLYEGRGPGGYLLLIEALTNNRNRTRPEIRNVLSKHG